MAQVLISAEEFEGYTRYQRVERLDEKTRLRSKKAFAKYMLKGKIIKSGFNDERWIICDQLHEYTINFCIDDKEFHTKAEPWAGCSVECYIECIKAYISFHLGRLVCSSLCMIANNLTKIAGMTADEVSLFEGNKTRSHIMGFLQLIPGDNNHRDQLIEKIEDINWSTKTSSSRKLANFKYYLRFNSELNKYWGAAPSERKQFYFPVWLWWELTTILPLRVTEFILTPRECLRYANDKCYLKIRRTRKKKGAQKVFYSIDKDYEICEYEIPKWMYKEIEAYINATEINKHATLGTLFIPREKANNAWYFSYTQLHGRLRMLCDELFENRKIPINLGDTRHLAMINLILSGGSPTICRELAGHEDINISANYYSNLSEVVESAVYETCHGQTQESMINGFNRYPLKLPDQKVRIGDGWCDYTPVVDDDISECLKTFSAGRSFGDCRNCIHYYPDHQGVMAEMVLNCKKKVDEDGEYLYQMIELVRRGLGYQEDIMQAMNRIQSSSYRYRQLLIREEMEASNATT